jgi:cyanophycinase
MPLYILKLISETVNKMDERNNHQENNSIIPKGILVAIGGNEDKENDLEILRTTVDLMNKKSPEIALITSASTEPKETAMRYKNAFNKLNATNVHELHIATRDDALNEKGLTKIQNANLVFFTGGDQLRITSILGGTPILKEIRRKYFEEECVVAGTSAGASVLSDTMIYEGDSPEALKKGTVQMTSGIGLVRKVVIDSHFIKRGRFSRLMEMVTTNPGILGLGLGEDTGVIISSGHLLKAIGQGLIVIFDGKQILHSNISDIEIGEAIAVQNVIVHTLVKGYRYDLLTREYMRSNEPSNHPEPEGSL